MAAGIGCRQGTVVVARIEWLPESRDDIERLYNFLYEKDVGAAMKASAVIYQAARLLVDNPGLGRPMPDRTDRRELFAAFGGGAYVLRYHIRTNSVMVIERVWHSRENR